MRYGLLSLLVVTLFSLEASAGTVTAVSKGKSLVKIDEGTPSGLKKGSKVCFYDAANKKVGCGSVTKSTESYSFVKVKAPKTFAKIKKGMTANLEGGSGAGGTGDITVASGGPDHRNNVKIGYVGSLMTP